MKRPKKGCEDLFRCETQSVESRVLQVTSEDSFVKGFSSKYTFTKTVKVRDIKNSMNRCMLGANECNIEGYQIQVIS